MITFCIIVGIQDLLVLQKLVFLTKCVKSDTVCLLVFTVIIVKKLNSLKHLVKTTVAESHN